MSFFCHEEDPPNPTNKKCTFLTSTIKEDFANFRNCHRRVPASKMEEKEDSSCETDDEQEVVLKTKHSFKFVISFFSKKLFFWVNLTWVSWFVQVVVSDIRSRAMEVKSRRKASFTTTQSLNFVYSPEIGELFVIPKPVLQKHEESTERDDEFFSVGSCLSHCSSARSTTEPFLSVKTNFSRCSSLSGLELRGDFHKEFWHGLDFQDCWRRRSIIQEVCHCEGWPFGRCRKALLLPPLPKSPSESWRKKC